MGFTAKYRNEIGLVIAIVAVILFTLIFNQSYIKQPKINITNILHQAALLGVFALGAGIVIIAGGIDLSSGSVIVASTVTVRALRFETFITRTTVACVPSRLRKVLILD